MKVLLAGATGAIGRPLLRVLREAGHDAVAVIRNPDNRGLVEELGATPVIADVMERDALLTAIDGIAADAVMHQATALRGASPRVSSDDPTNLLRTEGTANLIDAARAIGATRFVTQSLITGYGYLDHGERELTEDDPFGRTRGDFTDPIVEATVATERQAFEADGIDGIALRYGMFYGPRAFSDLFADLMRKRMPVLPLGGGGETCFVHVDDAAEAAVAALERGTPGSAYNIVDDGPVTWGAFIAAVAAAHRTPRPIAMPRWLLRLIAPYLAVLMVETSLRVSHAKATAELDWTPFYKSIQDGLTIGR